MGKKLLLLIVLSAIAISIAHLMGPETIQDEITGQEITLGPIGDRVSAEVGNVVQDFLLTDYEGVRHRLSDYRGKAVILNFWASWCPFCIEEMPLFEEVYQEYKEKGLEVIAINRAESLAQAREFSDPMNLSYRLLLNRNDDVYQSYNLAAMPTTFFIDRDGFIASVKFGPLELSELRREIEFLLVMKLMSEDELRQVAEGKDLTETNETESSRQIRETDGIKHSVPLDDILAGGPPKDGIPSVDDPKFVSVNEANEFLNDEGLGIAVSFDGVDRFYPNQITVWHEIVNDQIGDQPFLVTYCPLCGTGIVFDPKIDGEAVEFGTSGKLWNSNLVMYDRKTDTYWSQVLGEAIVGELTGQKLGRLPYDNVRWKDWKTEFPDGEVLSRETGHFRDYLSGGPYGDYDNNSLVVFPVDNKDERYHPKEPTFGIEIDGQFKVYPQSELEQEARQFRDIFNDVELMISWDDDNKTVDIRRTDDGEEIVPFYGFWFSWIAVHPASEVFTTE